MKNVTTSCLGGFMKGLFKSSSWRAWRSTKEPSSRSVWRSTKEPSSWKVLVQDLAVINKCRHVELAARRVFGIYRLGCGCFRCYMKVMLEGLSPASLPYSLWPLSFLFVSFSGG